MRQRFNDYPTKVQKTPLSWCHFNEPEKYTFVPLATILKCLTLPPEFSFLYFSVLDTIEKNNILIWVLTETIVFLWEYWNRWIKILCLAFVSFVLRFKSIYTSWYCPSKKILCKFPQLPRESSMVEYFLRTCRLKGSIIFEKFTLQCCFASKLTLAQSQQ